jgi:hypothetical protein
MLFLTNEHILACERIIALNVADIASELRQLDPADLVSWLHGNRYGNVAALINSSSELVFKPGTLRFAFGGSAKVTWTGTIELHLDMEFHHRSIDCYFQMHLARAHAGVAITYINVDGLHCRTAQEAQLFNQAMNDARLVRGQAKPSRDRAGRKLGANEAE